ncbi:MAG TPA: hypothetical protein VLD19_07950, partial [Chitinophagaceae bacterium]|nr:hypothetical protein [Chitinophagaceae bacterium]
MNCYRCNTENETGDPSTGSGRAHFCRQCGADLWTVPAAKDDGSRKTLHYVLILLGWEYFSNIVWTIVPILYTGFGLDYRRIRTVFSIVRWSVDGISLLLLVLFAVLSTNKIARILLIVFAVLRL